MKVHALKNRKQTPEHIKKRMESTASAKAAWSLERRNEVLNNHCNANRKLSSDPSWRKKQSISHLGKTPWNKGKKCPQLSGENHPMYGKNHTEEAKRKNALAHTGKKQSPEVIKKRFESRAGYRHSEETKKKIGTSNHGENNGMFGRSGELNPTWKGGTSFEPYPTTWSFRLREAIRNRDGRKCRVCGIGENGKRHDVHHINYDKNNVSHDNLATLCHPCHMKTNYNQEPWKAFFKQQQQTAGLSG